MTRAMWHRDAYARAVWTSSLKPLERLVALAYADHAAERDYAFVTYARLQERTGLSRDAVRRALAGLVEAGWLVMKDAARQHHSTRYWLRIPDSQQTATQTAEHQQSASRTAEGYVSQTAEHQEYVSQTAEQSASRTPEDASSPSPVTSSPSPVTSSPSPVPDHSLDQTKDLSAAREAAEQQLADLRTGSDGAVSARHAEAAAELLARHGRDLSEDTALACIAAVDDAKSPDNLARYVASFDLASIERWAGKSAGRRHPRVSVDNRCPKPGHTGSTARTADGDPLCVECEHAAREAS